MGEARLFPFATHCGQRWAADSRSIEADLADAIQRHALSLRFQPQFDLRTGAGFGLEALARWTLAGGKSIAPSAFIPIAERTGMIHALGAWVLEAACAEVHGCSARGAQLQTLSVNVSALQVNKNFGSVIQECIKHTGFPAKQLELEITESALIGDIGLTIECLKQWKELGVQIALDDFGTGYSNLNYLGRLPVDRLKVDQSLVQRAPGDRKSAIVLRSILELCADLGIDVLAEGVETEQQLQMLTDLGCPRAQGYLLGRPMPARQAQVTLRKPWGNRPAPAVHHKRNPIGECRVQ
jgi:EAL domain-containing protein (putative c-di-GMP-specific phosphodiesterase class I)